MQLGATTASYDREHTVNHTFPWRPLDRGEVEQALQSFVGDIEQVPPTYSAVKVNGERAYNYRRNGEQVTLRPKQVHIDGIELLSYDPEKWTLSVRVVCGKGTYIRALARDIGRALGTGAFLTSLRRTRVGNIKAEDCINYDHFREWLDLKQIDTDDSK